MIRLFLIFYKEDATLDIRFNEDPDPGLAV